MAPPRLDDDLRFEQRVEDFALQQFIAQDAKASAEVADLWNSTFSTGSFVAFALTVNSGERRRQCAADFASSAAAGVSSDFGVFAMLRPLRLQPHERGYYDSMFFVVVSQSSAAAR